ncbi:hypothetical protein WMF18_40220 [Sorangium sp. So ce315]|uniref:hypothetical protein n=1 Tax=Sorangium sp. So ce315 TaxID=3133299 RepID=UPI003F62B7F3
MIRPRATAPARLLGELGDARVLPALERLLDDASRSSGFSTSFSSSRLAPRLDSPQQR